jgi:bifunctional non-homologous end joining protein LigD
MTKKAINLFYKEGGSDKVYQASLEEAGTGWVVRFLYGRRGASLTVGFKTTAPVPYAEALKIYTKLVDSKTSKGYTEDPAGKVFQGAIEESRDTGIRPQLLNEIEESEVTAYLHDDDYCAQEKFDGRRRMILIKKGEILGTNRRGLTVPLSEEILSEIRNHIPPGVDQLIVDGEDMGNSVKIFDLMDTSEYYNIPQEPYRTRYKVLKAVFSKFKLLEVISTAWTTTEKKALYAKLVKDNAEGIVFKRVNSKYTPGRPNSGGDHLKFKFCATASCMVGKVSTTKRSVSLNVFDDNLNPVNVGNVTVYPNQEIPQPGDIVEVKYLYYFEEGSLFQPVLLGKRDDIQPDDCKLSKLKVKREEADA